MNNEHHIRDKVESIKGGFKKFLDKTHRNDEQKKTDDPTVFSQGDGRAFDNDVVGDEGGGENIRSAEDVLANHEFQPDEEQVLTSPTGVEADDAQELVWDNENASMQDKSYAFDETNTEDDQAYDAENDIDIESDDFGGSGQEDRYS